MTAFKSNKNFELFLFCFIINILLSKQNYKTFKLSIPLVDNELGILSISDITVNDIFIINDEEKKDIKECKWIPSLNNPVLLIPQTITISLPVVTQDIKITKSILFREKNVGVILYDYSIFNYNNVYLAKSRGTNIGQNCYFGISHGLSEYQNLNEEYINLNYLRNSSEIDRKIFSFSKWPLNSKGEIKTDLYFGDIHENFNSTEGIIGTCDSDKEDPFWGCIFTNISFNKNNNNSIELKKDDGEYYKIYFASEIYDIIIPISFKEKFNISTEYACRENDLEEITCDQSFFNEKEYGEIELIYEDKMNITIEIDNVNRFLNEIEETKNKTRIKFVNDEFFILPLIMFKNFHVQFDAENYKINFYTTNNRILHVKKDKKKEENKKGSSNAGMIFLVIFIILLLFALGFGIVWLIRKRRNSVENNINKYNKFEDEDNFKDMNEKRVF